MFFKFQKIVGMLVIPMGVGIFCFRDLITYLLLGSQWMEASMFIGLWGLTSSITIVLSHYSSEIYRAKGRPRLSVLAQVLHIVVLWPVILIAVKYGFETLYVSRVLVRLQLILVNIVIMYLVIKISPWKMFQNVLVSCLSAIIMGIIAYALLHITSDNWWQYMSIVICVLVYIIVILLFPKEREMLKPFIQKFKSRL